MNILMKGADVAKTMKEDLTGEARRLKDRGILPSLTIVRVGARPDDLAYERGARKRMEMVRYLAKNQVEDMEGIKGFNRLGYHFSQEYSDVDTLVFILKQDRDAETH